jgi:HTH-type transcriptional regulator / antitoxin MqsA
MTTEILICPVCEEGSLRESHYEGDFKHNGEIVHVTGLECYRCDSCGADPVFEHQIRRNHRKIADAKRGIDGLLTGDEIRAIREKLCLSQGDAAELFGGGANAFSKYERGDVLQSKAMDRLLRLVARYPFLIGSLRAEYEMDEHSYHGGYRENQSIQLGLTGSSVRASEIRNGELIDSVPWETTDKAA